jgi:tetratricopeptide (TPR) repeat protein
LDPNHAEAYERRGGLYVVKKEYDKAITDLTKAIQLDPKVYGAHSVRAWIYMEQEEYDKAVADYTEALRLNPKDSDARQSRGWVYQHVQEYDKALADYTEALRIEPNNTETLNYIAWFLATCPEAQMRDGKKAVEYARHACDLSSWKEVYALSTLAAAHAESGQFKEAIKWQKKALELAPESDKAEFRSRLELYKSGKPYRDSDGRRAGRLRRDDSIELDFLLGQFGSLGGAVRPGRLQDHPLGRRARHPRRVA